MTQEELVAAIAEMEPAELKALFEALAASMAVRAETVYDGDPEENGLLAQPYARIADAMGEAALAFEPPEPLVLADESAPTVTAAVRARVDGKSPWGGR
jgi:hypothetical protein